MVSKTLYRKRIAVKTKQLICILLTLMVMLVLIGCTQGEGVQNSIAGEWHQGFQGNQKIMTISSTCDSYSIMASDGAVVSGAIFQDEAIADEANAYVFYFEQPSVITSDPATNKINYRNMEHQVMYFCTGDATSASNNESGATLEGYYDGVRGKGAILDGSWYRNAD